MVVQNTEGYQYNSYSNQVNAEKENTLLKLLRLANDLLLSVDVPNTLLSLSLKKEDNNNNNVQSTSKFKLRLLITECVANISYNRRRN